MASSRSESSVQNRWRQGPWPSLGVVITAAVGPEIRLATLASASPISGR